MRPLLLLLAAPVAASAFTGTVVLEQSVAGQEAEMVREFAPSKITLHFGQDAFRQDEVGGLNEGSYLLQKGFPSALKLKHAERTSVLGKASPLARPASAGGESLPPAPTELEATEEVIEVAGYPARKFRVVSAPEIREDAVAYVWISQEVEWPATAWAFEFEVSRVLTPTLLNLSVESGTILKLEVTEDHTTLTTVVTSLEEKELAPSLFQKPLDYTGADFPPRSEKSPPLDPSQEAWGELDAERVNGLKMTMILMPAGEFVMGSPAEEPQRKENEALVAVALTRPFYLSATEVTQSQWREVMGSESPSKSVGDSLPVESVSWEQAVNFCQTLSALEGWTYRLPTEAEWEYAARAGQTFDFASMDTAQFRDWLKERAWFYDNAQFKTREVAQLRANPWGLYDMLGNVAEWTSSGYQKTSPAGPLQDPLGADSDHKVVRGGDWVASFDWIRPAARSSRLQSEPKATIGFRVASDPRPIE
ncbi:MAG: SUMF1/EgtB/PvdO family nonheme iron enzyme [Verrucomicrobiota bacterium]